MTLPSWPELSLIAGALLLGGLVNGLAGFGLTIVALPIMALVLPMKVGTPLCVLGGLVCSLPMTLQLRQHLDWAKLKPLLLGNPVGILAGAYLLANVSEGAIKIAMGAFIAAFSLLSLRGRLPRVSLEDWWGFPVGVAGGAVTAAFGGGGPFVTTWVALKGWSRDAVKATLVAYFLVSSILAAGAHALAGLTDARVLALLGLSLLPMSAGVFLGTRLYGRISPSRYRRLLFAFLLLLGVAMFLQGVAHLG